MARKFLGVAASLLANWVTRGDIAPVRNPKSADYPVDATDLGKLIECTGTWTLGTLAAATAGAGFYFYVKKTDGSGVVTLDPNASETINGLTTISIYQESFLVWTDGASWYTQGRQRGWVSVATVALTGQTLSSLAISAGFSDPEISQVEFTFDKLTFSASNNLTLRVSKSGAVLTGNTYSYNGTAVNSTASGSSLAIQSSSSVQFSSSTPTSAMSMSGRVIFFDTVNAASTSTVGELRTWAHSGSSLHVSFDETTAALVQGFSIIPSTGTLSSINYTVKGFRA